MKLQTTSMAKTTDEKKKTAGGIRVPDFRQYYQSIVSKIVCYSTKNKNIAKWNGF